MPRVRKTFQSDVVRGNQVHFFVLHAGMNLPPPTVCLQVFPLLTGGVAADDTLRATSIPRERVHTASRGAYTPPMVTALLWSVVIGTPVTLWIALRVMRR